MEQLIERVNKLATPVKAGIIFGIIVLLTNTISRAAHSRRSFHTFGVRSANNITTARPAISTGTSAQSTSPARCSAPSSLRATKGVSATRQSTSRAALATEMKLIVSSPSHGRAGPRRANRPSSTGTCQPGVRVP